MTTAKDSPRWCETCQAWGDHHTDRHALIVEGLETVADAMAEATGYPRHAGHSWVESSGFAGRFCRRCEVDEDDQDDPRWRNCP